MCQFCAATRLTTTILRSRACAHALPRGGGAARLRTLTTQAPSSSSAATKPAQTMSKGSFIASVAAIGGAAGISAAYVTTPSS